MPKLANPKHETFAKGCADGLKTIDAYTFAGYPNSPSSASQLKNRPEIQQRIRELMDENRLIRQNDPEDDSIVFAPDALTREWLITTLMQNVKMAQDAGQISPANKAVEMLAMIMGISFKKPDSSKPVEEDKKDDSGFNMDALTVGLEKIGKIYSKPAPEMELEDDDTDAGDDA